MRGFAAAWPDPAILQRVVGKLPWGQDIELLGGQGPRRPALVRRGGARARLEPPGPHRPDRHTGARAPRQGADEFRAGAAARTSDLAQQVLKDPYQFDFLTLRQAVHERDVERALVGRVKDLLLELGKGFSFIASQHHLEVGGQDFYVDLLFYHRKLRCLIAVDLKRGRSSRSMPAR